MAHSHCTEPGPRMGMEPGTGTKGIYILQGGQGTGKIGNLVRTFSRRKTQGILL